MAVSRAERRLVAVLAADVVGYSSLMERDEAGTLARLKAHRKELVDPLVADHRGRIVKLMGDGALYEFASVVDAVACAVAIQRGMVGRETDVSEAERVRFRVGVNLGDVIREEDGDLYGDGVNVAARLEQLAEPGGIVISGTAFDHLRGGLGHSFASLGEQRVKNIERPVRAYRMAPDGGDARPQERPALPLPDRPSLAVLPFDNLSGGDGGENGPFADGVVEDVLTALARCPGLFVTARNSSFRYRGRAVDLAHVGRELGVRYVLQGGVRTAGDRVRVTAQLIEARTGAHVWAERYDRRLTDVFALQEAVAREIATALLPHLDRAEVDRVRQKPPGTLEAYDCFVRGRAAARGYVGAGNRGEVLAEARRWLDRALALDPGYAPAHAWLAATHWMTWLEPSRHAALDGEHQNPAVLDRALGLARRAVDLDPALAEAHGTLGWVLHWHRRPLDALSACKRAVELNPNAVPFGLGDMLVCAGRAEDAIAALERAMRLDPFHPPVLSAHLGHALYMLGRYEAALGPLRACIARAPDLRPAYVWLAAAAAQLGRTAEARAAAQELLRLEPGFTPAGWVGMPLYLVERDARHLAEGLGKAGLVGG
jgi:adenylate cyclase